MQLSVVWGAHPRPRRQALPGSRAETLVNQGLAHVPRVAEGIPSRLRPHGEPMGLLARRDLAYLARGGVDRVDDVVVAAGEPERPAVRTHVAHVRAASARDGPVGHDATSGEVHHGHAPLPVGLAVDVVRAAVGDVELGAVAARIESVRALSRLDEAGLLEGVAVDHEDPVRFHVGHVEGLPVGRHTDVLGHPTLRQLEVAQHFATHQVDLDEAPLELAGEDHELPVDGEIGVIDPRALRHGNRALEGHGLRVAEIEPLECLRDHDGRAAVRREVHIVGIVDGHGLARLARGRIDGGEAPVGAPLRIVRDPERLEVPRGHDVLRIDSHLELVENLEGHRIDDVDIIGLEIGHVDAGERLGRRGAHLVRSCLAVEIGGIHHRRHARYGLYGAGSLLTHGRPCPKPCRQREDEPQGSAFGRATHSRIRDQQ